VDKAVKNDRLSVVSFLFFVDTVRNVF